MSWKGTVRQCHRWLSMLFSVTVAAIFLMLGAGREPAPWVYYLPLPPLALLMLSGLFLFCLPYAVRRRSNRDLRA